MFIISCSSLQNTFLCSINLNLARGNSQKYKINEIFPLPPQRVSSKDNKQ